MKCPKCGAENKNNAEFCSLCNARFTPKKPETLSGHEIVRSQILEARNTLKDARA